MNKVLIRNRHIDNNKHLAILLRENDDLSDFHEYSNINRGSQILSGMDKGEECEHHFQEALKELDDAKSIVDRPIPIPEVTKDWDHPDSYSCTFKYSKQYNRVKILDLEDELPECDMDEEDEAWLENSQIDITRLKFEQLIEQFERACSQKTLLLDEAKSLLRHESAHYVIPVYDYWLEKRVRVGQPLVLPVRAERVERSNNAPVDPYVAFRKRSEKMTTRKNRKVDETSYEKMFRLRLQMEKLNEIIQFISKRESVKCDKIRNEKDIFKKRYECKDYDRVQLKESESLLKRQSIKLIDNFKSSQRTREENQKENKRKRPHSKSVEMCQHLSDQSRSDDEDFTFKPLAKCKYLPSRFETSDKPRPILSSIAEFDPSRYSLSTLSHIPEPLRSLNRPVRLRQTQQPHRLSIDVEPHQLSLCSTDLQSQSADRDSPCFPLLRVDSNQLHLQHQIRILQHSSVFSGIRPLRIPVKSEPTVSLRPLSSTQSDLATNSLHNHLNVSSESSPKHELINDQLHRIFAEYKNVNNHNHSQINQDVKPKSEPAIHQHQFSFSSQPSDPENGCSPPHLNNIFSHHPSDQNLPTSDSPPECFSANPHQSDVLSLKHPQVCHNVSTNKRNPASTYHLNNNSENTKSLSYNNFLDTDCSQSTNGHRKPTATKELPQHNINGINKPKLAVPRQYHKSNNNGSSACLQPLTNRHLSSLANDVATDDEDIDDNEGNESESLTPATNDLNLLSPTSGFYHYKPNGHGSYFLHNHLRGHNQSNSQHRSGAVHHHHISSRHHNNHAPRNNHHHHNHHNHHTSAHNHTIHNQKWLTPNPADSCLKPSNLLPHVVSSVDKIT